MMKIALITHYYSGHRGGVEIAAGKLAENLANNFPLEINWLASDADIPPTCPKNLIPIPLVSSNIIERRSSLPYPIISMKSIVKLWQSIKKVDIVHIHDYIYMSNIIASIFAKVLHKPLIITQHIGWIPYSSKILRFILGFLNQFLSKLIFKSSGTVVFISDTVKKYFESLYSIQSTSKLIPNGTDCQVFSFKGEETKFVLRQQMGYSSGKKIIIFVGRFVEKKGLPIIKQVAELLPDFKFILVGWGLIEPDKWQLTNVSVLKNKSSEEVSDLYRVSDLLFLPSKGEGFPLVVQEAFACGLHSLISDEVVDAYPGMRDYIYSLPALSTPEIWAKKIEQFFWETEHKASSLELSQFAQQHWNWKETAKKYFQLYEESINRSFKNCNSCE
ncbi:MAG: hypothetical protein HW421_1633 [Ignavibacteria bacterium]|nr:hypothetical protein [Ignavibacteria bacterium]